MCIAALMLFAAAGALAEENLIQFVMGAGQWKEGVEKLVWFNGGTIDGDPATLEGLLAFEKATGIPVEIVEIPGETYAEQLLRTLALQESTYDVLDASYMMPQWAANGWILPLDDVIPEALKAQWDPGFANYVTYDGKYYAVPHYNQASVIAVRTDLLEAAGITKLPETWAELLDAAQRLTVDADGNGVPEQYGFVFPSSGEEGPWLFKDIIMSAGTSFWAEDGKAGFNNELGIEALQFLADLKNKYKVVPDGVSSYKLSDCSEMFNNGQAAMAYLSLGGLIDKALKSPYGDSITLIPITTREEGQTGYTQHAYAMVSVANANSKHPEAAKMLALWMGSYQQSWFEAVTEGNVPVNMEVFDSPYLQKHYAFYDVIAKVMDKSLVIARYVEEIDIVRSGLQELLVGNMTAEEAAAAIANNLNEII